MPHNATTIQRADPHTILLLFLIPTLQLTSAITGFLPCFSSFVLFAKLRLNFCSTIVDNFICIGLIFATWALCEWMECSFISFVNKLLYVIYVTICYYIIGQMYIVLFHIHVADRINSSNTGTHFA